MIVEFWLVVAALVSLLLGGIVIAQQPKVPAAILFAITMLGTALWSGGIAVFLGGQTEADLMNAAKIYYAAAAMIGWSTLLFALTFANKITRAVVRQCAVATLSFVLLTALIIAVPQALISSVTVAEINTATLNPLLYGVYTLYFAVLYLSALGVLLRRSHARGQTLRNHFRYMFVAYGVAGTIGMCFNLFLPVLGNYELIWVGPLGLLLFVPIVFMAIARHGLFDIKQTVVRTTAYAASLFVLALAYYTLAYLVSLLFFQEKSTSGVSVSPVNIALALGLAFVFQPIRQFFDRVTNGIFYRYRYNTDEFIAQLNEALATTTDLRTLLKHAAGEIGATLKAKQAFFFVQYNHTHHMIAGTAHHGSLPQEDVDTLNSYFKENPPEVVAAEVLDADHPLRRLLVSHKIAVIMPLESGARILGYLALGEQQGSGYTDRDRKTLHTIANSLVIAIQNALSIKEVRDINEHLEQRVHAATKELQTSNARLKRLDTTKDEFLSMASHQLRTPLTSIKGYLSMVLDGDVGTVTPTQRRMLEEAFTSSERMVHLIHDFLNVSRLQTGKFVLELGQVDLAKLVGDEVESLQRVAKSRNMTITYENSTKGVLLQLDDTKLRQVVMNYIDNAIYYSKEDTTIRVTLKKEKGEVVLKVHDTGIGVPPSEQPQLFEKFFRATNARRQRPDGTGVGLYLAKKVITAHGGEVLFSSKEGQGSVFGFRLPLEQDEALLRKNSAK